MRLARIVRTLGLVLVLGLIGSGGGCGSGSQGPADQDRQAQIKASKKATHRQIQEDAKGQGVAAQQGAMRKGARRGVPGR
jgi:hypothetical protein